MTLLIESLQLHRDPDGNLTLRTEDGDVSFPGLTIEDKMAAATRHLTEIISGLAALQEAKEKAAYHGVTA